MTTIVTINNINKSFGYGQAKTVALNNINFSIKEKEFISISGPSGCGKSTLLNILGLLDTPSEGEYLLADTSTNGLNVDQRSLVRNRHIGYVFQSFNLIESLTVFDNVALPLEHRNDSESDIQAKVMSALESVNMTHRVNHKPTQLSGGQQQRVAIARAIVGNPDLLLVDEPTGNLDSENGDAVMQLLKKLNDDGATIVMVTHDERYSQMAQRQIRLFDGEIIVEHQLEVV